MPTELVITGYVTAASAEANLPIEITQDRLDLILDAFANKPADIEGHCYRLRADTLRWELCEEHQMEEPQGYTAEQLNAMTNAQLSAILADMGISGSMTKANMIALILDKQNSIA